VDVPLLKVPYEDWHCPNCNTTDRTPALPPGSSRFHTCPRLHMLTAPLVRTGTRCSVVAEERQDYLGADLQAMGEDGKAYMSVRTLFNDHDDVLVNAGLARAVLATEV
jgi:hypothetical protein